LIDKFSFTICPKNKNGIMDNISLFYYSFVILKIGI